MENNSSCLYMNKMKEFGKNIGALCICLLVSSCAKKTVPGQPASYTQPPPFMEEALLLGIPPKETDLTLNDLYVKALESYHRGNYQQSLAKLTAILNEDYTFSEAYWARGEIYYDLKKLDLAEKDYRRSLQYDSKMVVSAYQLARIYLERQEFQEAKKQLEHILTIDSRQPKALKLLQQTKQNAAKFYLTQGQSLVKNNQDSQAIEQFNSAVQEDDTLYEAWLELGRIRQLKGESKEAITNYKKALSLNHNLPVVWKELGKLYLQSAAYDQARHAFQNCLMLDPNQTDVQELLQEAQVNFYHLMDLPAEYLKISSNQTLTRGELAAILVINLRVVSPLPKETTSAPIIIHDIAGHWAQKFINYAIKRNWMHPYPNHKFLPSQIVTRGELAAVLNVIIANQPEPASVNPLATPIFFADISPENQFYQAIIRTSKLGILTPYQQYGNNFLPDKPVSGVEALEIVDRLVEILSRSPE